MIRAIAAELTVAAFRVARATEVDYFAKKHGLTRQQAQDLIKKHGNNRKERDAAAERLKGGGE